MQTRTSLRPALAALALATLAACGSEDPGELDAALRAGAPASTVVMTRNLYVGADLFLPFTSADPLAAAAQVFADVLASDPAARMDAVADEIARARPDLVGLQEAYLIQVRPLASGGPAPFDIDFLGALEQSLAARPGLSYRRVVAQPHTALTVPLFSAGVLVTIVDRDAILADADVVTSSAGGGDFDAVFTTSLVGIEVVQKRGWAEVQAEHRGASFTFVDVHLETKSFGPLQSLQALELLARFGAGGPLVLVGDFNSDPGDPAPLPGLPAPYALLTSAFEDAWRSSSIEGAYTCCFDADISPPSRPLFERVDLVLLRGATTTRALHRTGVAPISSLGGWPSDHAGVVGHLRFEP